MYYILLLVVGVCFWQWQWVVNLLPSKIYSCRKIHWFQKCYSLRPTMKNNEVIAENQTVASPGACGRLAILNWRSSSIHPSSFYCIFITVVLLDFLKPEPLHRSHFVISGYPHFTVVGKVGKCQGIWFVLESGQCLCTERLVVELLIQLTDCLTQTLCCSLFYVFFSQ